MGKNTPDGNFDLTRLAASWDSLCGVSASQTPNTKMPGNDLEGESRFEDIPLYAGILYLESYYIKRLFYLKWKKLNGTVEFSYLPDKLCYLQLSGNALFGSIEFCPTRRQIEIMIAFS